MLLSLSAGTVVLFVSFAHTNMQKELPTGQNIDSQAIALDLGVVQKGEETGILGFSIIVAAVNFLLSFAGVFGGGDVVRVAVRVAVKVAVTVALLFTSEGGCSDSSGEEEYSERLDRDHFD